MESALKSLYSGSEKFLSEKSWYSNKNWLFPIHSKTTAQNHIYFNPTHAGFYGTPHTWGGKAKRPPFLKYISYNDETWYSYTLPKEDLKTIWITWHALLILLTSAYFKRKSASFAILINTDINCILIHTF